MIIIIIVMIIYNNNNNNNSKDNNIIIIIVKIITLLVTWYGQSGESRPVRHFWLTCWPLAGRPEPISLVRFLLDSRPLYEDSGAPLLVHCR